MKGKKIMKYNFIFLLVLLAIFISEYPNGQIGKDTEMIYFNTNEFFISDIYSEKIRNLLLMNKPYSPLKIKVVGHTDDVGSSEYNFNLGRDRANSVKLEIMSMFSFDSANIYTESKGEDEPIANNLTTEGRAKNRRVEIIITERTESVSSLEDLISSHDPNKDRIDQLLNEADSCYQIEKYEAMLERLGKAKELGGDKYSEWCLLMGNVGYVAGSYSSAREMFQKSLDLDSTNYHAKRGLARIRAREQIINGEITLTSGRDENDAIKIDYVAQEKILMYGFFNVTPIKRKTDYTKNLDIWTCGTDDGNKVTYYFDFTNVYNK
jgi:tetratricopeptide (TPR) repeat protein